LYLEQAKYAEAERVLIELLEVAPGHVPTRKLLAAAQLKLGNREMAIKTLDPITEGGVDDPQILAMLGQAYTGGTGGQQISAGIEMLQRAAKLAPGSAAGLQAQAALGQLAQGATADAISSLEGAIALDSDDVRADVLLVLVHLREGRKDDALIAGKAFVERKPEHHVAHTLLGGVYQHRGDFVAARKAYERSDALAPEASAGMLNLARLDAVEKKYDDAKGRYAQVLKSHPKNTQALSELAALAFRDNDHKTGLELLERARSADAQAWRPRVILANYYGRIGAKAKAILAAEEAARLAPLDSAVGLTLARAQAGLGELGKAEATLVATLQDHPNSPDHLMLLAVVQQRAGRLADVRATLQRVLKIDPHRLEAVALLARVQALDGDLPGALARADELKQSYPNLAIGFALEGDLLAGDGQHKAAIDSYQQAQIKSPDVRYVLALSKVHRLIGEGETADRLVKSWALSHPEDVLANQLLGEQAQLAGDVNTARNQYERALERDPKNVAALNNLAWIALEDSPEQALNFAERAHAIAPAHPAILDTYGWVLFQNKQSSQAVTMLERSVKADPGNREHQYHLAAVLADLGEAERAQQVLETILRDDGEFRGRADALTLLAKLAN
jgi:putative PEP-CTERM system TPR-repeat lipoprotein